MLNNKRKKNFKGKLCIELKRHTFTTIASRFDREQLKNNIAGRLPENSRNSFVDLQSKKTVKKENKNTFLYSLN